MSDPRPTRLAVAAAVALTIASFAVLIGSVVLARQSVRSALVPTPPAAASGPAVKPYNPLQDELRVRMRELSWPVAAAAMAGTVAYIVLLFVGMIWVARDATNRGASSGTWVLVYLAGHLIFTSAAVSFLIFPAVLPYALPVLPLGWIGLAVYLLLRRKA